ncbi:DUF4236 domain-containing protein [Pseudomonas sp. ChxA]|uniref:DUF4236 domain-containing protein n=1 Tax=Pseudomonas sp. ChxA TaxID=3035473 RepID=UPI0025523FA0|nr:DUF4236 domain-containing protein [Pseudomonas sp. ChxA]MDL2185695.1 DUF4236 domain-containing protein [Pseudomonas sp. ChxA]
MGLRYRKRIKIANGLWLNLSGSGVSLSMGGAGATINLSSRRGATATFGIPGTGFSYRTSLGFRSVRRGGGAANQLPVQLPPVQPIQSETVEEIAEIGMQELQQLILDTYNERQTLDAELSHRSRAFMWRNLFATLVARPVLTVLFLRKLKQKLADWIAQWKAQVYEIRAIIDGHGLQFDWSLSLEVVRRYESVIDSFDQVSQSKVIWDITGSRAVNRLVERSNAQRAVDRVRVLFQKGRPRYLPAVEGDTHPEVPVLRNANGADIYLFPGFVLLESPRNFAVVSIKDMNPAFRFSRFRETDGVPSDSRVLGYGWERENKNGSRDRRFKENRQIPIACYGQLGLTGSGMNEEYQFSNAEHAEAFAEALASLRRAAISADDRIERASSRSSTSRRGLPGTK